MKSLPMQAIGHAMLVGVDRLNPTHFGNSCDDLISPRKDVEDYELIAKLIGLKSQILIGEDATRSKFINTLTKNVKSLKAGDFLLLAFSGYGGLVANFDHKMSEAPFSKSWCLFDGQLLVSEVLHLLSDVREEVSVLVLADTSPAISDLKFQPFLEISGKVRKRALPIEVAETVYLKHKDYYDAIYLGLNPNVDINGSVIWLSACQINQFAYETNINGNLTSAVKHVWNGGNFTGTYELFFNEVALSLPAYQSPNPSCFGKESGKILKKRAFTF